MPQIQAVKAKVGLLNCGLHSSVKCCPATVFVEDADLQRVVDRAHEAVSLCDELDSWAVAEVLRFPHGFSMSLRDATQGLQGFVRLIVPRGFCMLRLPFMANIIVLRAYMSSRCERSSSVWV